MNIESLDKTRARQSRMAIEQLYIAMRHLFIRGGYKPMGASGEALTSALKTLQPEIYGSINDPERIELDGLLYIFQRLPKGIEECRQIRFIDKEGLEESGLPCIIPSKRRRNAYRVDTEEMYIELSRGRSDIYDILTHLTFMYIEAEKIRLNSQDYKGRRTRDWRKLEEIVLQNKEASDDFNKEVSFTYLSTLLGRTYSEIKSIYNRFDQDKEVNSLFHITYYLGRNAMAEHENKHKEGCDRVVTFSSVLRKNIGHHNHGDSWASQIKRFLYDRNLLNRPLHIISANLHSVMNSLYSKAALKEEQDSLEDIARQLSLPSGDKKRKKVNKYALQHGMFEPIVDSGTNIGIQIIDTAEIDLDELPAEIRIDKKMVAEQKPVILVMDYAFGEQAYEVMDELLKPYENDTASIGVNAKSISVMGKAGILTGGKGDIMVPNAHIFEGTADNYPFENDLTIDDFKDSGVSVCTGPMVTVLGTSLQNKDVLKHFMSSSWKAIGLEMEGAHYQKAIQSASKIRNAVDKDIVVRYAYYASDNPLLTGHTLASGGLGMDGVKSTYLITTTILSKIFGA